MEASIICQLGSFALQLDSYAQFRRAFSSKVLKTENLRVSSTKRTWRLGTGAYVNRHWSQLVTGRHHEDDERGNRPGWHSQTSPRMHHASPSVLQFRECKRPQGKVPHWQLRHQADQQHGEEVLFLAPMEYRAQISEGFSTTWLQK